MKKFLTFVMLFVLTGFSVGCEQVPPEVLAQRKVFVEQLKTLHAGDLIVETDDEVRIIKRVNGGTEVFYEGESHYEHVNTIAKRTKEIVLLSDPRWSSVLKTSYEDYRKIYDPKEPTTSQPTTRPN